MSLGNIGAALGDWIVYKIGSAKKEFQGYTFVIFKIVHFEQSLLLYFLLYSAGKIALLTLKNDFPL